MDLGLSAGKTRVTFASTKRGTNQQNMTKLAKVWDFRSRKSMASGNFRGHNCHTHTPFIYIYALYATLNAAKIVYKQYICVKTTKNRLKPPT